MNTLDFNALQRFTKQARELQAIVADIQPFLDTLKELDGKTFIPTDRLICINEAAQILEQVFIKWKKWYSKCIMRKKYETDLTDEQWEVIKPLFVNMRKRKWDKLHSFYRRARLNGLWDKILQHLVKVTRQKAGLNESPTQADDIGCLLGAVGKVGK